jgi:hypothetical protein
VVARFESDRQALAKVDHPHVANVLDATTTKADQIPQIIQVQAPC